MKNLETYDEFLNESEFWKEPSERIEKLRKAGKKDTTEFYQAYADYYDGMAKDEGDSNGYYYSQVQKYTKLAHDSSPEGQNENKLRAEYLENIQGFFKDRLRSIRFDKGSTEDLRRMSDMLMGSTKKKKR